MTKAHTPQDLGNNCHRTRQTLKPCRRELKRPKRTERRPVFTVKVTALACRFDAVPVKSPQPCLQKRTYKEGTLKS